MRPPEDVRDQLVRQWLHRAGEDLGVARLLIESNSPWNAAIAFHCQQAVEKSLKALLVHEQIEFPKTHDIGLLVRLTGRMSSDLPIDPSAAATLTPYGVDYRYPGDLPEVTPEEARSALEVAEEACDAIRNAVAGE